MKTEHKPNTKNNEHKQEIKSIHKGCGGKIKPTLGRGQQYGSCVCVKCGAFFD